ncbi:MAG: GNAT family N-acetyltransferase [Gemmatimonadota bacterium]
MKSRIVESPHALHGLLSEWQQLFERDPRGSARNGPHRLLAFHRIFTPDIHPRVIVVRDHDGKLRGVLPVGLRRRRVGPVVLRGLVPLIGTHAYHFDAVIDPDHSLAVGAAIAEGLNRIARDGLALRHVRPGAWLLDAEAGVLRALPALIRHEGLPSPRVRLGSGETIRGRDAKEMHRLERHLFATGDIRMGWEPAESALVQTIDELMTLHTRLKRWQKQRMVFLEGSANRDFPPWLASEIGAGRARLFTIRRDGRLLAGCILFCNRDEAHSYRVAWDPDEARLGLGILITTRTLEACEASGLSVFDLGPGTEPYKAKWHPEVDQLTDLRESRDGLRSRIAERWLRLRGHTTQE